MEDCSRCSPAEHPKVRFNRRRRRSIGIGQLKRAFIRNSRGLSKNPEKKYDFIDKLTRFQLLKNMVFGWHLRRKREPNIRNKTIEKRQTSVWEPDFHFKAPDVGNLSNWDRLLLMETGLNSDWNIPHSRKPRHFYFDSVSPLRLKRALKGGGSSRAVGSIHKSSGSQISRR